MTLKGDTRATPSALAFALAVLDVSDCARAILIRAYGGQVVDVASDDLGPWSRKELQESAEGLAHQGLLLQVMRPGPPRWCGVEDMDAAFLRAADAQYVERAARDSSERWAIFCSIWQRIVTPPRVIGVGVGETDAEFGLLADNYRFTINAFPDYRDSGSELAEKGRQQALSLARRHPGHAIDIVSPTRCVDPWEGAFFEQMSLIPQCFVGVVDNVPLRIALFDGRTAVLPTDPDDHVAGAMLVDDVEAVAHISLLLARQIATAVPIRVRAHVALSDRDMALLALLAAGLTDEAIARRLRVTDRTIRRAICHLEELLGVSTRFQMAVEAAKRGLL